MVRRQKNYGRSFSLTAQARSTKIPVAEYSSTRIYLNSNMHFHPRKVAVKLIQIYECLCDETRLRILNLLSIRPLCVSHLQKILQLPQVKISKHLTYMKKRGMVEATRLDNWMLYSLTKEACPELESNLKCLQDCSREYPVFTKDLKRLQLLHKEIDEVKKKNLSKQDK